MSDPETKRLQQLMKGKDPEVAAQAKQELEERMKKSYETIIPEFLLENPDILKRLALQGDEKYLEYLPITKEGLESVKQLRQNYKDRS